MSTPSNPFEELMRLTERMNQQFEETTRTWSRDGPASWLSMEGDEMSLDLVEHDDEFVAAVDLPGFERDEVTIRVTDHRLEIDAEHEAETEEEEEHYLRHERTHRELHRSVRLPDEVDTENVEANMRNGVLTVTLPKREVTEARTIEIEES
ncbi:Hsp20/alpha crystallin family protein [Haloarchaeobius litoreus]|uniref:Hsp20/alpha crystallin family protein n=1 Tax=Haloarchaeobius litoreus TaxID=755306 RepID=A0ABD6DNR4_9EURY|nr:Hsp20/alpha crystallin family protein [Haloarchaeobius litoreus]